MTNERGGRGRKGRAAQKYRGRCRRQAAGTFSRESGASALAAGGFVRLASAQYKNGCAPMQAKAITQFERHGRHRATEAGPTRLFYMRHFINISYSRNLWGNNGGADLGCGREQCPTGGGPCPLPMPAKISVFGQFPARVNSLAFYRLSLFARREVFCGFSILDE